MKNSELDYLLNRDPLATAEKIIGKTYHEDESVVWLGMALGSEDGKRKDEILSANGDTCFMTPVERYMAIVLGAGFKILWERPAVFKSGSEGEKQYGLWHDDGLFLVFDTFHGFMNGGDVHFNLRMKDASHWPAQVSGGFTDGVLIGSFDAREAILYRIESLKSEGEFLTSWVEAPHLRLLTSGEYPESWDEDSMEAKRNEVIALIPEDIKRKMAL
jgi:hypothetical protein